MDESEEGSRLKANLYSGNFSKVFYLKIKVIPIKNTTALVFKLKYPKYLQSNNGNKSINMKLLFEIENFKIEHIFC